MRIEKVERLIACADLHITASRPINRIDVYFDTVLYKFSQIIEICNKYNCDLAIAGDIFDSSNVGHKVVNSVIEVLNKLNKRVFLVAGQHDMVNHKILDMSGSPLQTLVEKGKVIKLTSSPFGNLYGASFGEEVPEIEYQQGNILVVHKCITLNDPPFYLEDEGISSTQALEQYSGYQLIISGDFHSPFVVKGNNKRILINCGPMMRSKIDYIDYAPRVYYVDIKNLKIKALSLDFENPDKVFRVVESKKEGMYSKEFFDRVITSLKNSVKTPDFKKITYSILSELKDKKVSEKAKDIIRKVEDERC